MPAIHGGVTEKELQAVDDHIVGRDGIETRSEAVKFAIEYTLYNKFGIDPNE